MLNHVKHILKSFGLIFIVFLLFSQISVAEKANLEESERVSRNWMNNIIFNNGNWAGSTTPEITFVQDIIMNDTLVGWYFEIEPTGYIIVPILKEMAPIKIYSDENWLDWTEPDGPTLMIKEILLNRVQMFVNIYGSIEIIQPDEDEVLFSPEQRLEWDKYLVSEDEFKANQAAKNEKADQYGPMLTSTWHQSSPYYYDCPWGDGNRTLVGCVATAAAQILKYHEWPPEGTGSHTMYWGGDNSCGGNTPGQYLTADYTDPYDWANILDNCSPNCNTEQQAAMSELNYETAVALNMHFGRCGSGAYTADVMNILPEHFRFYDWIEQHYRTDHGMLDYSDLIRVEIENNRPCQYRIHTHSIVCDGWRLNGALHQLHMNYGWGGSNNYWYTIDNLHCPWEGCSPSVEYVLTKIEPDRGVMFTADTTLGDFPLEVSFEGISTLEVDTWTWDFGDGNSAFEQSPKHTYNGPGRFDVSLEIDAGGEIRSYSTTDYITVLADTVSGANGQGEPGELAEVIVYAANTLPVRKFRIPVEYGGSLNLTLNSFSSEGCRTEYFDVIKKISSDNTNKRATFSLYSYAGQPDLAPGSGPILKLYFGIPANATPDQTADIIFDGYSSYELIYYTSFVNYTPIDESAEVSLAFVCGDANDDESVNILDVTSLISYLYQGGPAPAPLRCGDVNNSGNCNILDVTYLITFLYKYGPDPSCP